MTQVVTDARIDVHYPGNEDADADVTVPNTDIQSVDIAERLQDDTDGGTITLHDDDGTYTKSITSGDMVRFQVLLDTDSANTLTASAYGNFAYGTQPYGKGLFLRWAGIVRRPVPQETGPHTQTLRLEVQDFVFGILSMRTVTNAFKETAISGSNEAILETILSNQATEIDQRNIDAVNATADANWRAKSLLECVRELSEKGDALLSHRDDSLIFRQLSAPGTEWTLADTDRGLASAPTDDADTVNQLQVEGGEDTNVDDEQTTQTSTSTVTDSSRLTQQLSLSKSEVALVEVYTETTGSGDTVVVRIHPDNGSGSPVEVGNREQDLANRTLASEFLADGGFTTFLMPTHSFAKNDPHLLIESDGSTGQDVGTDGSANPTYKAHYPFRLATVVSDQSSISTYRRREGFKRAPAAQTKGLTEQRGRSVLRHRSEPADELEFTAESNRAHHLRNGDVIDVDEPHLDVSGEFILVGRTDTYDGGNNQLTTSLRFQDVTTV